MLNTKEYLKESDRCYFLKTGRVHRAHMLHAAYEIATGNKFGLENFENYELWLQSLMGKSIAAVKPEAEVTIEEFIRGDNRFAAQLAYRRIHGCSNPLEAKRAVDRIAESLA